MNLKVIISSCTHTSLSLFTIQIDIHNQISPNYKHSSQISILALLLRISHHHTIHIIMISFKQSFISWLLISTDPAGRLASARRVYLGGSSTKDDGGKHLRALPAPNQEGSEDMFLGSSTFKNPVEVPVSHIV